MWIVEKLQYLSWNRNTNVSCLGEEDTLFPHADGDDSLFRVAQVGLQPSATVFDSIVWYPHWYPLFDQFDGGPLPMHMAARVSQAALRGSRRQPLISRPLGVRRQACVFSSPGCLD